MYEIGEIVEIKWSRAKAIFNGVCDNQADCFLSLFDFNGDKGYAITLPLDGIRKI